MRKEALLFVSRAEDEPCLVGNQKRFGARSRIKQYPTWMLHHGGTRILNDVVLAPVPTALRPY